MKLKVLCKTCGKQVMQVIKDVVSDSDLSSYERSCACDEHGGNTYEYDEDGNLTNQVLNILAVRSED